VIHRMLWCKEGCAIPAVMQACCHDPQNALWKKVLCPALLLAVVIHRMPGRRCYPLPHASCCHDPQNALVEEGVLSLRCHASSLLS
jgi:hypothetical protein